MPAPKKYPHQSQLDSLAAHQGISLKSFSEEIIDDVNEWNRAWSEKGKPGDSQKLLTWSKEICHEIDEYLSQYEMEEDETELTEAPVLEPLVAQVSEQEITPVSEPVEAQVLQPVSVALVAPEPSVVRLPARKVAKLKISERISKEEQALEKLYNSGKLQYSKKELIANGFDPGFFGWSSTGWSGGKRYAVKKKKTDIVYAIVKL